MELLTKYREKIFVLSYRSKVSLCQFDKHKEDMGYIYYYGQMVIYTTYWHEYVILASVFILL
jgi:hypothetical protein